MAIPIPPVPDLSLNPAYLQYVVYGSAALMGLLLLLWGRNTGRPIIALAAAGVGVLVGPLLAEKVGMPPMVGQATAACVAGILAFVLARLIWALVLASVFDAVALGFIIANIMGGTVENPPTFNAAGNDFVSWATALGTYLFECFEIARKNNLSTLLIISVPAGLLPLMVALIRPRLGVIAATGLTGAVALTASLWLIAVQVSGGKYWPEQWSSFLIPLGVAAVIAIIGWVYQGNEEFAEIRQRQKAKDEAKPPEKKDDEKVYIPKDKK